MKKGIIALCFIMSILFSMKSQTVESVVADLKSDFVKTGWTFVYENSGNTTDEYLLSSLMRTYTPGYMYAFAAVAGDCRGCEVKFLAVYPNEDESESKANVEMKGQVIIGSMIVEFDVKTTVEIFAHVDSRYSYFTRFLLYQKKK